jgi:hypothetical protein
MEWGFVANDLTSVAHYAGTGLLDFSGQVAIVEAVEACSVIFDIHWWLPLFY